MAKKKGKVSLVLEGYAAYKTEKGKKRYRNINNPAETISYSQFRKRAERVIIPLKVQKPTRRVSLKVVGYEPYTNERGTRRYRRVGKPAETISQRQFRKLAHAEIDPQKQRERGILYRVYVNRQRWIERGEREPQYVSTDEAMDMPEFLYYEALINSRDPELRDEAYDFYDELYDLYINKDWGETP